jgi:trimeric autotransporter adhesin
MFSVSVALGFLLMSSAAVAQQYVISTVAGGAPPPTPITAVTASIPAPKGVAVDNSGNIYFSSDNCVFKINNNGLMTRVAGNVRTGYSGDGGPAIDAQLYMRISGVAEDRNVAGLAVDQVGNLYMADTFNDRVRKVSPSGIITTVAGNGTRGDVGDGGSATSAELFEPNSVAVDTSGNLFIAENSNRVRKVSPSGVISTLAGNGTSGYSGDGGLATSAQLRGTVGVAVDASGNVYIADSGNLCIRVVSTKGVITTFVVLTGTPIAVTVNSSGNLYISANGILAVSPSRTVTTVAGNEPTPYGLATDASGNLYLAEFDENRIRKVSASGIITTVAGNGNYGYSGDMGAAPLAQLNNPWGVAADSFGNIYIADSANSRVRKVSPGGIITTVAGTGSYGYSGDGGPASNAILSYPEGVAVDAADNLYIADTYNGRVRKVSTDGIITTVVSGGTGNMRPFVGAVAVDQSGNMFIADGDSQVWKVSPSGTATVFAGNGTRGYSGDNGAATSAQLSSPWGVGVDSSGSVYIADYTNQRIRKVSPSGIISTVAGNGSFGYSGTDGDNGPATSAKLYEPTGVCVDASGSIYIANYGGNNIRKVSPSGIITTIAGNVTVGYSGDHGSATNAQLNAPRGVAVDAAGNVYVADTSNSAIRLLQPLSATAEISAVSSAASNLSGPIAPGEIIVLYGSAIGPSQIVKASLGSDGLFDAQLAGTTVSMNGILAPVLYTWATQVSAIVPYGIGGSTAQVAVSYKGQTTAAISVPFAASAPSIFTLDSSGKGQAAAINQDDSVNTSSTRARIGDVITLFATGEGQTSPSGVDGKPASMPLPQPLLPVKVAIGGQQAQVQYAGAAPGEVAGVMQVNVQIPSGIQTGNAVPISIQVGNASSQPGVTIAVQ